MLQIVFSKKSCQLPPAGFYYFGFDNDLLLHVFNQTDRTTVETILFDNAHSIKNATS